MIKGNGAEKVRDLEHRLFPSIHVMQKADAFGFHFPLVTEDMTLRPRIAEMDTQGVKEGGVSGSEVSGVFALSNYESSHSLSPVYQPPHLSLCTYFLVVSSFFQFPVGLKNTVGSRLVGPCTPPHSLTPNPSSTEDSGELPTTIGAARV